MLEFRVFGGLLPRMDPINLPPYGAQVALNCDLRNGTLRAIKQPSFVWTPTKPGQIKTIYRFGQDVSDETLYWFHWTDDVDVVKGQVAGDTDERTYFTGDSTYGHPRWTKAALALTGGGTNYPIASYKLGIPAPTTAPGGSVSGTGTGTTETRVYVYTFVGTDGEEGAPSLPFEINAQEGQTVTLNGIENPPADHNINRVRIYRTLLGQGTGTNYQFVAEIASGVSTYADSIASTALGRTMNSIDFEVPPAGLLNLRNMPNGMIVGSVGSDVYFCEPYRPYAWPSKYVQPVAYPIVGIGVFGYTAVICTKGKPSLMFGTSPDTVTAQHLPLEEACIAKSSIVEMGWGVVYASNNGLVSVDGAGAALATDKLIDRDYWQSLNPSTIRAYHWNGKYIGFYNNGTPGGFIFDPKDELQPFALMNLYAQAGYTDPVRDGLFLLIDGSPDAIYKFSGQNSTYTYTWRSRQVEVEPGINYSWGKVVAKAYPVTLRVYSSDDVPESPTFGQMILRHTRAVANQREFSMPSGFRSRRWEIELEGTNTITRVLFSNDTNEIRRA